MSESNLHAHYSRHNPIYPQDSVETQRPSYTYEGKITESGIKAFNEPYRGGRYVRIIDGSVRVDSVTDEVRSKALEYFNSLNAQKAKEMSKQTFQLLSSWVEMVGGTGIAIGAPLLSGACLPLTVTAEAARCLAMTAPVVPVVMIAGVAMAILGIKNAVTSHRTLNRLGNDQKNLQQNIEEWQDPITRTIEQRRTAGARGFQYALENNLKGKVVHPEELQDLWIRDFSRLVAQPKNVSKIFSEDLLGAKSLSYAWDHDHLPDLHLSGRFMTTSLLKAMTTKYRELRDNYFAFKNFIDNELTTVDRYESEQRSMAYSLRSDSLRPARLVREQQLKEVEVLYQRAREPFIREKELAIAEVKQAYPSSLENDQINILRKQSLAAIEKEFENHPSIIAIEQAYANDKQKCHYLYQQSKLMVDAHFDHRIQMLNDYVRRAKDLIDEHRSAGMDYFSRQLDTLFRMDFEAAIYGMQNMPSPTFSHEWRWPDVNQTRGWQPYRPRDLTSDISESIWNLFCGCVTSSQPSWDSMWSNLFTNREPFNLRAMQNPIMPPRLFRQPIASAACGREHAPVGNKRTQATYGGTRGR